MKANYKNLDMLRSLAVLSVVAQHLWHQSVNFGFCAYDPGINQILGNLSFTGVMFFFVHTCLVLMLSMHRAPADHLGRDFLIRRAFRIYPLCWATILLALTTGLTDHPEANFHSMGWQGVAANLALIQNMLRSYPSIVGPLWSLPWEVQMYLVLPLFFIGLRRFSGLAPVFATWLVSAVLAIAATQPSLPRMLHGAIFPPMFIGGMVAYVLLVRQSAGRDRRRFPAWTWPLFVLGLFLLKDRLAGPHNFESQIGAGVNTGICLLLAVAIPSFGELRSIWLVHPAQQIAKYSYGIYLLHEPALIFVMRYLPRMPLVWTVFTFFLVTALVSFISFHLIENPLIRTGKWLTRPRPAPRYFEPVRSPESAEADLQNSEVSRATFIPADGTNAERSKMPTVSIITPVYNAALWLPDTLASVRAQTFADWEQILVDDGSTDDSVALVEAAARDDARYRLIRAPRNGGPSAARNLALDAARGRFIAFLDADDLWLPKKLARSVEWMTAHKYAFIYHDYRHMSNDGARVGALITAPELLDMRTLHTRRGHGGCLSIVIDRQQILGFRFPENFRYLHEDFCARLSLIQMGHIGHRLPEDLGRYRLSATSRSANRLTGAMHTWKIYRKVSHLSPLRAARWWMEYAWSSFWLHRLAVPR